MKKLSDKKKVELFEGVCDRLNYHYTITGSEKARQRISDELSNYAALTKMVKAAQGTPKAEQYEADLAKCIETLKAL